MFFSIPSGTDENDYVQSRLNSMPQPKKNKEHEVKKGENLWKIAKRELGSEATNTEISEYVLAIAKLNGLDTLKKMDRIYVGTMLDMPEIPQESRSLDINDGNISDYVDKRAVSEQKPKKTDSKPKPSESEAVQKSENNQNVNTNPVEVQPKQKVNKPAEPKTQLQETAKMEAVQTTPAQTEPSKTNAQTPKVTTPIKTEIKPYDWAQGAWTPTAPVQTESSQAKVTAPIKTEIKPYDWTQGAWTPTAPLAQPKKQPAKTSTPVSNPADSKTSNTKSAATAVNAQKSETKSTTQVAKTPKAETKPAAVKKPEPKLTEGQKSFNKIANSILNNDATILIRTRYAISGVEYYACIVNILGDADEYTRVRSEIPVMYAELDPILSPDQLTKYEISKFSFNNPIEDEDPNVKDYTASANNNKISKNIGSYTNTKDVGEADPNLMKKLRKRLIELIQKSPYDTKGLFGRVE